MSGRAETQEIIPGQFAISVGLTDMPSPPGWIWVKLQDVARLETGHTPSREHPEYWDGEIGWIGIKDGRAYHGGIIQQTFQTITQLGLENSASRLLPAQTVCLSRTASVGYVVIMGKPMATSQDFVNWSCSEAINPRFLMHLLVAEKQSLLRFGKGSTHTTIYFPEVKAFHVCLPPVEEQRRLVKKVETLKARTRDAREALEEVPGLINQYRQSVLAAAFQGDLTADWRASHPDAEPASVLLDRIRQERRRRWEASELARMKSPPRDDRWKAKYQEPKAVDGSDLPELPEGWCWATLDHLSWDSGYGTSAKCEEAASGVAVFRIPNVARGEVNDDNLKYSVADQDLPSSELLAKGDFLIVRTNGSRNLIGRGAFVEHDLRRPTYFASYLIRYRLLGGEDLGRWLASIWQSPAVRDKLEKLAATTAGQLNVSLSKLSQLVFPVPALEEIRELNHLIQNARERSRSVEVLVEDSLEELGALDKGILAKAFRGELVPQDPNDEPASTLLDRIRAERQAEGKGRSTRLRQRRLTGLD